MWRHIMNQLNAPIYKLSFIFSRYTTEFISVVIANKVMYVITWSWLKFFQMSFSCVLYFYLDFITILLTVIAYIMCWNYLLFLKYVLVYRYVLSLYTKVTDFWICLLNFVFFASSFCFIRFINFNYIVITLVIHFFLVFTRLVTMIT